MSWIGLDIGGANLKAAHQDRAAVGMPFPLWQRPEELTSALRELLAQLPSAQGLAVTMTGELADCYASKPEGVQRILDAVEAVAAGRTVRVWQTGAEFLAVEDARELPELVAAANWHALATFLGRLVPDGPGLLLDIGTTTTDVIPLADGVPVPEGNTDPQRLASRELIYSGVRRTPLCSVAQAAPFRNGTCLLAAELFATIGDVYRITGDLPSDADDRSTADGRPATASASKQRLARMLCADADELTEEEFHTLAEFFSDVHRSRIRGGVEIVLSRQPEPPQSLILSGSGAWLATRIADEIDALAHCERHALPTMSGASLAESACAYAVCRLAVERETL